MNEQMRALAELYDQQGIVYDHPLDAGKMLQLLRLDQQTPIADIAHVTGLDGAQIAKAERRGAGAAVNLQRIARALGYDIKFVLVRREKSFSRGEDF